MTDHCDCPSGLGYRFHRHSCAKTGQIEGHCDACPFAGCAGCKYQGGSGDS